MGDKEEMLEHAFRKLFVHPCDNYIFIYTPPKVGSTTLVTSLRVSLGKTYNVIHIHDDVMLNVLTGINVKVNEIIHYIANQGKKVFVFDVYRSPIERKMSEYFEKLSPYHFNNSDTNISKYNIKRIINRFNRIFPYLANKEHYFDQYQIDNPTPFHFHKKYSIQIVNKIKYVKIRLIDSDNWNKILSEILQTNIVIINDYQTNDKGVGDLYRRFKEEYNLPENYYHMIEQDKYLLFYYSEEERNAYLEKWKNKKTDSFVPYTPSEFKFYIQICLENQFYNDIQLEHYIDNGCFCKECSLKRKDMYFKALKGEPVTEKITHNAIIIEKIKEKSQKIIQTINTVKNMNKAIHNMNKRKLKSNKFGINTNLL
jgi:hypothetical protein